jgi:hypothetical protein
MLLTKTRNRRRHTERRFLTGMLGLLVQGIVWASALIALFFAVSKLPSFFHQIPPEILFACEALVALAALLLFRLLVERKRTLRAFDKFARTLRRFQPTGKQQRVAGLPAERMHLIQEARRRLTGKPHEWWLALEEALEYYEPPRSPGGWFLTRPAEAVLTEDDLIAPFYHASFHQAVPSILTALGLLATFSAILVALSGVKYNGGNTAEPVTGIDTLINGLAGKFLASIIGLILSLIFTFVEKKVCERRIMQGLEELRNRVRRTFPFLSQTRILLDLQRIATQTISHVPSTPVTSMATTEPAEETAEPVVERALTESPNVTEDLTTPPELAEEDPIAAQFRI